MGKHLSRRFLDSLRGDVWLHLTYLLYMILKVETLCGRGLLLISEESFLTFSIYWT